MEDLFAVTDAQKESKEVPVTFGMFTRKQQLDLVSAPNIDHGDIFIGYQTFQRKKPYLLLKNGEHPIAKCNFL